MAIVTLVAIVAIISPPSDVEMITKRVLNSCVCSGLFIHTDMA